MKMQPRAESGQDTHPGGRALAAVHHEHITAFPEQAPRTATAPAGKRLHEE